MLPQKDQIAVTITKYIQYSLFPQNLFSPPCNDTIFNHKKGQSIQV